MVRVIQEEHPPQGQVRCNCCGALLEYDRNDIKIRINNRAIFPVMSYDGYITCPNCKNNVAL